MCDELFDWAFGDDEDDLNEALLQASNEFESKITLMQQLHPWLWLHLELCLEQAPPTKPSFCLCHYKINSYLHCQKHHRGFTEIITMLLTNQLAVF